MASLCAPGPQLHTNSSASYFTGQSNVYPSPAYLLVLLLHDMWKVTCEVKGGAMPAVTVRQSKLITDYGFVMALYTILLIWARVA